MMVFNRSTGLAEIARERAQPHQRESSVTRTGFSSWRPFRPWITEDSIKSARWLHDQSAHRSESSEADAIPGMPTSIRR